jgi:NTP pyrophosphatase (non-canonical NTP hydrolase)
VSYLEDSLDWQVIHHVDEWLDRDVPQNYQNQPLAQDWARISKVIEELGEAVSAMIGYTGQNPRKGITHNEKDMVYELADVAMTAILAIQHFTKETATTRDILKRKQEFIYRRMRDAS